jgi:hypothetical protein
LSELGFFGWIGFFGLYHNSKNPTLPKNPSLNKSIYITTQKIIV